ncbi:hypothetical protein Brsp04_04643 [Brucella sp. NBRC 12952]
MVKLILMPEKNKLHIKAMIIKDFSKHNAGN